MKRELVDLLKAYLMGWKTVFDCAKWLAGVDWSDPDQDADTMNEIGLMELLATEVLEGLRPETDFRQEAVALVQRESKVIYVLPDIAVDSPVSSAANEVIEPFGVMASEAREPQPWNISPQPVSA